MKKTALITGITGQDGAYLAKLLLTKGYEVIGTHRRNSLLNYWRLEALGIKEHVRMVEMEMLEFSNILQVVKEIQPQEIYNLAGQSFVSSAFTQPLYTSEVNALGTLRLLEAIRTVNTDIRFYQASSSEMFGNTAEWPQTESTPFCPRSPYGVAKLYAHWMTVNYRESYGLHLSSGILFNHESPLRSLEFVTRKITCGLVQIKHGHAETLMLGNLNAQRDWGFAGDYVAGMWKMLQHEHGDDYILATGKTHSVRQFVEAAAACCGITIEWRGEGMDEQGLDKETGKTIIKVSEAYCRPAEISRLQGNAAKAHRTLGWQPQISFEQLVEIMMKADLEQTHSKRH